MTSRRTLCNVRGCNNNIKYNRHLSFFTLPKDEERRDVWLKLIGRPDLQQKRHLRPASHSVCSDHFDPSMIILIPKLKPEAIPTKNLPGTNVANFSKYGSSDSSESSDSESSTPITVPKINEKDNITNPAEMVKVVKGEKDNLESVHIKKEKYDPETQSIKMEKDDPETQPIKTEKDDPETQLIKNERDDSENKRIEEKNDDPVTVHVKIEKDASDSEPVEEGHNDLKLHIKEEKQDSDTETSNSLPLKTAIFTSTISDAPTTSTCKPTKTSEFETRATDTSTQTMFSKIKKCKKNNENVSTETVPVQAVSQTSLIVPAITPDKRTIQNIIESESKRRRV